MLLNELQLKMGKQQWGSFKATVIKASPYLQAALTHVPTYRLWSLFKNTHA